ncbi:hypothetical protein CONPUDRAFT_68856 [Coniophora puteana RWD-64-598 SS2]|uniref:Uncharacterized protein n=1 Tax=Coniophora puteana (strain RWD-64-598) TaxID=741705 RepID=A0A5M3N4S9_CONPW|nr:uncharacterized protein CONPUDRAFT_68856 [Coniophora puteana RWD-64-598 SS2]EIW86308.1 hypothetical protein CONPUDRAFT_68856 [Coniophora puteana RWD-64-598 SS2]
MSDHCLPPTTSLILASGSMSVVSKAMPDTQASSATLLHPSNCPQQYRTTSPCHRWWTNTFKVEPEPEDEDENKDKEADLLEPPSHSTWAECNPSNPIIPMRPTRPLPTAQQAAKCSIVRLQKQERDAAILADVKSIIPMNADIQCIATKHNINKKKVQGMVNSHMHSKGKWAVQLYNATMHHEKIRPAGCSLTGDRRKQNCCNVARVGGSGDDLASSLGTGVQFLGVLAIGASRFASSALLIIKLNALYFSQKDHGPKTVSPSPMPNISAELIRSIRRSPKAIREKARLRTARNLAKHKELVAQPSAQEYAAHLEASNPITTRSLHTNAADIVDFDTFLRAFHAWTYNWGPAETWLRKQWILISHTLGQGVAAADKLKRDFTAHTQEGWAIMDALRHIVDTEVQFFDAHVFDTIVALVTDA